MKGAAIAYNPCYKCTNKIMCEMCELKLHRDGVTIQKWISVKDRLPEKEENYLLNVRFPSGSEFMVIMKYEKGVIGPIWENATHWMPLPQPPKGE